MPQPITPAVRDRLIALIDAQDDVVTTRYGWSGEYALTTLELRKHVGPPDGQLAVEERPNT